MQNQYGIKVKLYVTLAAVVATAIGGESASASQEIAAQAQTLSSIANELKNIVRGAAARES